MRGIFIRKDYVCAMSTCVHLHTPALESGVIFQTRKDYCVALAHMAMAAAESDMEILAYALMSNHFHFILKGADEQLFFQTFLRRFSLYLGRHGNPGVLNGMEAKATPITTKEQFRTEIAYVVRNPFVVREDIHPFVNIQTSARQFAYYVMKNVEAQVEVARRLGEKPVFPDEELLPVCRFRPWMPCSPYLPRFGSKIGGKM